MYSYGPPHMAKQKQDDQLKHTYSSYVGIRDVALKTCQERWMIGRSGERGSGISVLTAWHDDEEDISSKSTLTGSDCTCQGPTYGWNWTLKIISIKSKYLIPYNCKLFVLRIVTWSHNRLLRIIICYLKLCNCVQIICVATIQQI